MSNSELAVIFDMDGVLIDSVPAVYKAWATVLADHGVDLAQVKDPHGENHKGSTMYDLLSAVKEQTGAEIDPPTFRERVVTTLLDDLRASGIKIDSGAQRLLNGLRKRHVPMAIATSASTTSVFGKLEILGIKEYFDTVISADDITKHKPDPEVYITAARRLGIDNEHCVVFEDSIAGVASGKAANMKVIGFTKYSQHKSNLTQADVVVDDWAGINYSFLQKLVNNFFEPEAS